MSSIGDDVLISVLVTVYNRERYLAQCLNSIQRSTYKNFELIIVDDQSTDRSFEVATEIARHDSRIKVFLNSHNLGDYPNRNRAASLATGKYLKYVDSDDMIEPNCLQLMVEGLEQHPDAAYALSYPRPVGTKRPLLLGPREAFVAHTIDRQGIFSSGPLLAMIRADCFRKVGGFRPTARNMGDTILWMELSSRWPMLVVDDGLTFWRQHDGQEFHLLRDDGVDNTNIHCQLTSVLLNEFINSPNCPLTRTEKRRVRLSVHKNNLRRIGWHMRHGRWRLARFEVKCALQAVLGRPLRLNQMMTPHPS